MGARSYASAAASSYNPARSGIIPYHLSPISETLPENATKGFSVFTATWLGADSSMLSINRDMAAPVESAGVVLMGLRPEGVPERPENVLGGGYPSHRGTWRLP